MYRYCTGVQTVHTCIFVLSTVCTYSVADPHQDPDPNQDMDPNLDPDPKLDPDPLLDPVPNQHQDPNQDLVPTQVPDPNRYPDPSSVYSYDTIQKIHLNKEVRDILKIKRFLYV